MQLENKRNKIILYCTLAGLISASAISGLLEVIDYISGTPRGTFFAVIGLSLGFNEPISAQYIGFGLNLLTGTVAGNIFGQLALFWRKLVPNDMKMGVALGLMLGVALWAVLFIPLATFGIQPRLDSFMNSEYNTYANSVAEHFAGLYYVVVGASLLFHLIYGSIFGLVSSRMLILRRTSTKVINTKMVE